MSWDVMVQRFSRGPYISCEEIPADDALVQLGTCEYVRATIDTVFKGTDWSDTTWGVYESDDGSIEFNISSNEPCESVMLHVRAGDRIVESILDLGRRLQGQILDCSNGVFLDQSELPTAGLSEWQVYREKIMRD